MENISKSFGKVQALRGLDFTVDEAEIVGLVGDNGAGKSTLIKVLMGVFPPDEGRIFYKGEELKNHSPDYARRLGIEPVYQDKALTLKQVLWRNIFLGREECNKLGVLDVKSEKEETRKLMKETLEFSGDIKPDSTAKDLSGGERQGLAIARALHFEADLIILDEPTTALSLSEMEKILHFVKTAQEEGTACIYISHSVDNVYRVANRIDILDRGKKVESVKTEDITLRELKDKLIKIAQTSPA